MEYRLDRQNIVIRNNILIQILKGNIESKSDIEKQLNTYNINFDKDSFIVIIFQINDFSQFSEEDDARKEFRLAQFVIENIYEEIISRSFKCVMVSIDDLLVCILNCDSNLVSQNQYPELLDSTLSEAFTAVVNNFKIDFITAVSDVHNSITHISQAYREALDALVYTNMLGNIEVIYYPDTLSFKSKYDYPIEKEYRFMNLIKIGDYGGASKLLDKILDSHLNKELVSAQTVQCLMFDLLSTIIKTLNMNKEQQFLDEAKPIQTMMKCKNISQMKNVLYDILYKVCINKKEEISISDDANLSNNVKEYILKNYNNIDLNVSMIGEYFNMTPAYLSKLYKQDTGKSILNAINNIRIQKAKKLLKNTNYTIGEIANKVGYSYSNTFIRVFKKYEGVTPGQYKSLY